MLQVSYLRENKEEAIIRLNKRGLDATSLINKAIELDDIRKDVQQKFDSIQADINKASKSIGALMGQGKKDEAEVIKNEIALRKDEAKSLELALKEAEANLIAHLYTIPNAPQISVPNGKTPEDNEVVSEWGNIPQHDGLKPHWEISDQYGLIDFELGVKITGAGFPVYKGKGARLQRALINFFLDEADKAGYQEFEPPFVVNEASGIGTGQLPDKEGQMYYIEKDDLYLIPTAEVPLTNFFRDVILTDAELPAKLTAYTPCFRREAGSYGKDVKGLNRLHQFDKVEIVQVVKPENSYQVLEEMLQHSISLLKKLELPFRVLKLCGGDMGFASALTYDLEVFSAGQGRWLEVSSVSNFETFQSNRLKLRYRDENGKPKLAHTLNGSALALPRILASLLENHYDGNTVKIPEALVPYTRFSEL
jgi:seryl-tRNA synthetase